MTLGSPTNVYPAVYFKSQVNRHAGNPFIEAQPELLPSLNQYLGKLKNSPPKPTAKDRKKGDMYRVMELPILSDIVYPFPEFAKAGAVLATLSRECYVARHPLKELDLIRRHAIASGEAVGSDRFPSNWKSSAQGHIIVACSGMGKTTFLDAFLLEQKQVIKHTSYHGKPLNCYQVTYIKLRIPHDGTLKGLCVLFFLEVDRLLGTPYAKQARAARTITGMVQLMNEVATAISLGFLVVDELQNLSVARGGHAQFVLNLFIEIIEGLGISLVTLATPAVEAVLEKSIRNTRKILTMGQTTFPLMEADDNMWDQFCDELWEYTFTKKHGRLTRDIRNAWHRASAGNTAFASVAFGLAQRHAIGSTEVVDTDSFAEVLETDMAFLMPAINALNSGNPDAISRFDDLMFSKEFKALRKQLGYFSPGRTQAASGDDSDRDVPDGAGQEFDEVVNAQEEDASGKGDEADAGKAGKSDKVPKAKKGTSNTANSSLAVIPFPIEDPMAP